MQRKVIKSPPRADPRGAVQREPLALAPPPSWRQEMPASRGRRHSPPSCGSAGLPRYGGKHPFPCGDCAVRGMSCRKKPYSVLAVASPAPVAIVLLEVLAYRGFVNRKISVMGIQVIGFLKKKKKILPSLQLAFLFLSMRGLGVFLKNSSRIMACGPDLAKRFGRRRSAAAGRAVPCWRCAVLPRPGLRGEKKPRLASARRWLL